MIHTYLKHIPVVNALTNPIPNHIWAVPVSIPRSKISSYQNIIFPLSQLQIDELVLPPPTMTRPYTITVVLILLAAISSYAATQNGEQFSRTDAYIERSSTITSTPAFHKALSLGFMVSALGTAAFAMFLCEPREMLIGAPSM